MGILVWCEIDGNDGTSDGDSPDDGGPGDQCIKGGQPTGNKNPLPGLYNGAYIVVINASNGANGFGHNALIFGSDKFGWTLISKEGRVEGEGNSSSNNPASGGPALDRKEIYYNSFDAFLSDHSVKEYNNYTIFSMSADKLGTGINTMRNEAGSRYNLMLNNCSDAVSHTLDAIGLKGNTDVRVDIPNISYFGIIQSNYNLIIYQGNRWWSFLDLCYSLYYFMVVI